MDEEDTPDLIAAVDQSIAGLTMRAKILGAYFEALIIQGFQRAEALELARDYQTHIDDTTDE